MDDDAAERALEDAMRALDALPAEVVREAILARPEIINAALDAIADVARNAPEEADRQKARQLIADYGLELLLLPDGTSEA